MEAGWHSTLELKERKGEGKIPGEQGLGGEEQSLGRSVRSPSMWVSSKDSGCGRRGEERSVQGNVPNDAVVFLEGGQTDREPSHMGGRTGLRDKCRVLS